MKRRVVLAAVVLASRRRRRPRCRGGSAPAGPRHDGADGARREGTAEAHSPRNRRSARRDERSRSSPRPSGACCASSQLMPLGCRSKAARSVMEFDPGRSAVRARAGEVRARRGGAGDREDEGGRRRAGGPGRRRAADRAFRRAQGRARRIGQRILGAIDAQKNVLSLEEARRRLAQLQEDVKSRAATNQASLAVSQEKRNKAQLAMQRAQQVIDSLVIRRRSTGRVLVKENRDARAG